MAHFISLTDSDRNPVLINVEEVSSVGIRMSIVQVTNSATPSNTTFVRTKDGTTIAVREDPKTIHARIREEYITTMAATFLR